MLPLPSQESCAYARRHIIGCVGWSGAGKTRLMTSLIRWFCRHELAVCVLKHSHHRIGDETPQKDSAQLRAAGAREVVVIGRPRGNVVGGMPVAELLQVVDSMPPCAIILAEGFKQAPWPKIEVHRPQLGQPPLWPTVPGIIAVTTDAALDLSCSLPVLDLNRPESIGKFLHARLTTGTGTVSGR